MKLEGIVIDGLGKAKYWVGKISTVFKEKTNYNLVLGTLNIKLNEPYIINPDFIIKKEEFGGTENVLVKKCKILGKEAYMVRAEKNQKNNGEHGLDIIEIVGDVNFRETYNLMNNQRIIVSINS